MNYTKEQTQNLKQQTFAHLQIEESNHILTITLNRPEKKNAISPILAKEIAYAINYAHYSADVWVVVLGANGDVFCAGGDLKAFMGRAEETISTIPEPNGEVILGDLFNGLHKPCIAKVKAPVYAGGFLLICGCTYVYASPNTVFGLPEVKRGLWPFQVMQSMLQVMSPRAVLDYCLRGKTLNAGEAQKIGLVSHVTENVDAEVQALAEEITQYSPSAIRLGLEAFDHLKTIPESEAHVYLKKMLSQAIKTEDAKEGMTAFAEKRKPNWKGV
ncbi:MAG: enoyl-CoA hydratase-related protein [Bacteroidia bacterium]